MSPERAAQSYADTDAFNQRLMDGGHFVYANGIAHPSEATLVDNRDGAGRVTTGPYISGTRYLGGFWIVTFDGDATAQQWAMEASQACHQTVEIRRFHGSASIGVSRQHATSPDT